MDSLPSQSGRAFVHSNSSNSTPNTPIRKSLSDTSNIQNLSSILNNPHSYKSTDPSAWLGWWSSSTTVAPPDFTPLIPKQQQTEISLSDFLPYLSSISETYSRFEDIKNHSKEEQQDSKLDLATITAKKDDVDERGEEETKLDLATVGQGEALVACLREVPSLYFKEDFALEDGPTFQAACPFTNASANLVLQEKLSQYLDVVELHLVKEIALRSNSFFEAQGQLEDLNMKIVEGCERIRGLKETIRVLDKNLVESAREIHELNVSRGNLVALQNKLRLILYVNQALSTLKLLVASADCAGALDVTDDLQQLLDGDELAGLHCFRHLRDHVAAAIDSINSILSAEFIRASIHGAGDKDWLLLSKAKARDSVYMNGKDEVKLDDEEISNFRDRLLPLIVGLLRTAKLPSVLRIYRDTLTASMKTTIKTVVAELLPTFSAQSMESDFTPAERTAETDGGGLSLASKLRSLSSENFVQLLSAIFNIVQAHLVRAAEVKKVIEWIMNSVDGHYAADSVAAAIAAAAAAETTQESDGQGLPFSPQRSAFKLTSSQVKANDASSPSNISRNFRADILRENTEAVFAACDASHGRWAKLLGVRALLHPRLRLVEFLSIYNSTQEFITATEKIGGRLGYSIRGTMQSQAKAFVDFQHEMRMTKIRAVIDQETWVEVDVPDEFQVIVASLFYSEPLISECLNDTQGDMTTSHGDLVTSNDGSQSDSEAQNDGPKLVRMNSIEVSSQNSMQKKPTLPAEAAETNDVTTARSSAQGNNHNVKERGKSSSQTLSCGGVGYHMVNCGLILLKMLSEYIDMNNFLPTLSSEVVHRVVEILKFFNTRTCQLILGAGAMQVSGLKSITSKHLALASQVIGFVYAIIPEIRRVLFLKVPETRKALLLSEIDRVAQDYKVHQEEILTKLVQIMRERLLHHIRGLSQIVESWNRPVDSGPQPSQFAQTLTKEVSYLQRVLSRTLHEADIHAIFRQVVVIFHKEISEAFSRLEISSPQAKIRLHGDIIHILGCIRSLPSGSPSESGTPNWGQLDEFLVQRFGSQAG